MKSSIHIVSHGPDLSESYLVKRLSSFWQEWGYEITSGPADTITADIGFMHIDRTKIFPEDVPHMDGTLINRHVLDISKDIYSTQRVCPDSGWDGPVIVKSTLNYYGVPEWYATKRSAMKKMRRYVANRWWQIARMLPSNQYPILPSVRKVPGWVWKQKDLIVERFLPDMDDGLYSVRGWLFFGDKSYNYRVFSKYPVVKAKDVVRREIFDGTPAGLEEMRQKYRFDYGKFDYVEIDGRAIVIDMNKTPASYMKPDNPALRLIAEGIHSYCEKKASH